MTFSTVIISIIRGFQSSAVENEIALSVRILSDMEHIRMHFSKFNFSLLSIKT